jgi:phosphatidylinositol glycan class S
MQLFIGQLRELLGIHQSEGSKCWDNVHGLSVWEVDILTRRHLISHVKTTISTLSSLYSLVYNLTNMVVKDNIGDLCRDSIDSLHKTLSSIISDSDYDNAIKYARISLDKAEQAFFDPNMLSLLYFPEEHKYAIYALPFFPIAVQVFKAIYEEIKVRRQKSLQPKPKPKLE